jgi:hypothetical protein
MRTMLARVVVLPFVLGAVAACGDEPPAVSQPRPVLSTPNNPSVADALPERYVPQLVNVTFVDGVLTGDVGSVPVVLGSVVRLTLVTDVVDTVVIEGFDQTILTAVNQPTQIELLADEAGAFDVRLQDSGQVLTTLDVG